MGRGRERAEDRVGRRDDPCWEGGSVSSNSTWGEKKHRGTLFHRHQRKKNAMMSFSQPKGTVVKTHRVPGPCDEQRAQHVLWAFGAKEPHSWVHITQQQLQHDVSFLRACAHTLNLTDPSCFPPLFPDFQIVETLHKCGP